MAARPLDLTGQRFGRLFAEKRGPNIRGAEGPRSAWICRCDCGSTVNVRTSDLRNGTTRSCGCLRADENRKRLASRRAP